MRVSPSPKRLRAVPWKTSTGRLPGYTVGVTAKQLLHEYVDRLSEDDAELTAAMLIPGAERRLRDEERAAIERGLKDAEAGNLIPLEETERELGID